MTQCNSEDLYDTAIVKILMTKFNSEDLYHTAKVSILITQVFSSAEASKSETHVLLYSRVIHHKCLYLVSAVC